LRSKISVSSVVLQEKGQKYDFFCAKNNLSTPFHQPLTYYFPLLLTSFDQQSVRRDDVTFGKQFAYRKISIV